MRATLLSLLVVATLLAAAASSALAFVPITSAQSVPSTFTLSVIDSVPEKQNYTATGAPFTDGRNGVRGNEAIGFDFSFYGVTYSTVGIGYNGNLQFGDSNVVGLVPVGIPTTGIPVPMLAWYASDLNCVTGHCGGGYGWRGVAPNREFIVRAVNWTYQTTGTSGSGDLDIDVVLHERTNVIEVRFYSVTALPSSSYDVTIGVQQTVDNWLAVLSRNSTVNTTAYLQGRTLVFTPAPVSPASSSSSSSSTGTSVPAVRPKIIATTSSDSAWYSIVTADSVPALVSFNRSGTAFSSGSNGVRQNQLIGFTFDFFGVSYTHVGIGYNGNLQWGASDVAGILPASIPSPTQTFPIFAWFGADLNCMSNVCGGGYGLIGAQPNRQFIIRIVNWTYQVTSAVGSGDLDIDIVLTETENSIEVRYYSVSALPSSNYKVTIGMQNALSGDWLFVLNRTSSVDVKDYLEGRKILFVVTDA